MKEHVYSYRVFPEQWIDPVDFTSYFDDPSKPLEVDLGCGKGKFLLQRSSTNPDVNFLAIDRMLVRIRKIDKKLKRRGIENVRVFRFEGDYTLNYLIPEQSVNTYYYFFPDPWPKKRHHENRMFKMRTVDAIHKTLKPGGILHIATDHMEYFEEMHALMAADERFESAPVFFPSEEERTDFELMFRDTRPTCRCSFRKI
ncbi:tRNA (guanosine(46)-N7)-methyltransferase TrmB [Verrucomicrobiota bacterium]